MLWLCDSSIQFETSMSNSYNHVTHDVDIFPIDRIFPCDGISVTAAQENMFGSETSNFSSSTVRLKCQYQFGNFLTFPEYLSAKKSP